MPHRAKQLCSFSFHCGKLQGRGVMHRHPDAISAFLRNAFRPLHLATALPAVVVLARTHGAPAANRRKSDKKERAERGTILSDTRLYRYACPLMRSTGNVACHARALFKA